MDINYIALAIPIFFILIGIELVASRVVGRSVYRFQDAITDLNCGVTQQVFEIFYKVLIFGIYFAVERSYGVWNLSVTSIPAWIIAFLGVDVLYYWWHRLSHEKNALWAIHVVHHQSQDYNLAVALRQALFSSFTTLPFYLSLAIIGIPLEIFFPILSFSTLYQFWIHTELVPKLPIIDWVFNVPSHHRVHHAINPKYLDKNYAATLIVWDRLFGTFIEEQEPPVYGTVKPFKSLNPLWANFEYWAHLIQMAKSTPRLRDKALVFWKGPQWTPPAIPSYPPPPDVSPDTFEKFDPPLDSGLKNYVLLQYIITGVVFFAMVLAEHQISLVFMLTLSFLITISVIATAGLFEQRSWAVPFEHFRLLFGTALTIWFLRDHTNVAEATPIVALIAVAMAFWVQRLEQNFRA